MKKHKTVYDKGFKLFESDKNFDLKNTLTTKLDNIAGKFDQQIINEIVLWKVSRYAQIDRDTLELINSVNTDSRRLDMGKTKILLKALLKTKGIQLPMASTILRFKNKKIYQIIDQRVYRVLYAGKKLKLKKHTSEKNLNEQIALYLKYLQDLSKVCKSLKIPFETSDRILFMVDRRINKDIPLDNYSSQNGKEI
jgi:hypothetical protein